MTISEREVEAALDAYLDEHCRWLYRRSTDKRWWEICRDNDPLGPIGSDTITVIARLDCSNEDAQAECGNIRNRRAVTAALLAAQRVREEKRG